MKSYIGAKIIQATPMSEAEFNRYVKGAVHQAYAGKEDSPGYLVIYPDGYKSWSPKDVFENAYREIASNEKVLIEEAV